MSKIEVSQGDWIVVCDGGKALILKNEGDEKFPNFRKAETYEHSDDATRALGTDAPGRSFHPSSPRRSAVDQTDWHDEAERSFLQSLAKRLDDAIRTGETKSVVMIASPRALGMIRDAYSPALAQAITLEVHKDIVKLPIHVIESLVMQYIQEK